MCCRDDGGCNVVALLFSLVEWSERHMDRNTATCTDVHCVWDRPRKESKLKKLDDVGKSYIGGIHPYNCNFLPIHDVANDEFEKAVFELVKDHDTQIVEVLDTDSENNKNEPFSVPMLALSYKQNKCTIPFIKFLQKSVKLSDCDEINNLTEGQSENVNWYKYRVGRVTTSIVHDGIRYRGISEIILLLKRY